MPDDPTPRELTIQLQALVDQFAGLARRFETLTTTLSTSYVPRGEYVEARKADERRFDNIEDDIEKQAGWRRQVTAGVAVGVLLLIVGVILALARIPGVS